MRIGYANATQSNYYDRGATLVINYYVAALTPHAFTQRWAYTVPTGFRAHVECTDIFIERAGAGAPDAPVQVDIRVTPSGGSATVVNYRIAPISGVGTHLEAAPISFFLFPGDLIEGRTTDGSTGGTINYAFGAHATQYSTV